MRKTIENTETLYKDVRTASIRESGFIVRASTEKREATQTLNSIFSSVETGFKQKQTATLKTLDDWKMSMTLMADKNIETLKENKRAVERYLQRMEDNKPRQDSESYVDMVQAQHKVSEINRWIDILQRKDTPVSIQFAANPELVNFLDNLVTFADIESGKDNLIHPRH